jgi:hypothetical protein
MPREDHQRLLRGLRQERKGRQRRDLLHPKTGSETIESVHRALAWERLARVIGYVMSVIAVRARQRKCAMQ